MVRKFGVLLAVFVLAAAVLFPAIEVDSDDTELFSYYSQLDGNGIQVYKEVSKATSVDSTTKEFSIDFSKTNLYETVAEAEEYAEYTVNEAITACYLTNPMIPYIWNYPVDRSDVEVTTVKVKQTIDGQESWYYAVDKANFSLTVPEGITSDSMKALNEAIQKIKPSGNTEADKVRSIMGTLSGITFQKDGEGKISNIYNALVDKKSTSAGVAQAFVQLCTVNNIPAITVSGYAVQAKEENFSFWNYVYLEGDQSGVTKKSWYIVDSSYSSSAGIAGYLTEISFDGRTYSMSSAHYTDLEVTGPNDLVLPQVSKDKYVQVGGPSFLELYGEKLLMGVLGLIVILGLVYAIRTGNI